MAAEIIPTTQIKGQDITNKVFGRWTVVHWVGLSKSGNQPYWKCRCSCGGLKADKTVYAYSLILGKSVSCGCHMKEVNTTHGMSRGEKRHPLYRTRIDIFSRCQNPNNPAYSYYGGKGISVDPRWESFEVFLKEVISEYERGKALFPLCKKLTIDRIDNEGGYYRDNIRFVPHKIQMNNTRRTKQFFSPSRNETHTTSEWADITGIEYATLVYRFEHYPVDDALLPENNMFYAGGLTKNGQKITSSKAHHLKQ